MPSNEYPFEDWMDDIAKIDDLLEKIGSTAVDMWRLCIQNKWPEPSKWTRKEMSNLIKKLQQELKQKTRD